MADDVGGVGHASQKPEALVFLPGGKKGTLNIGPNVEFGMKIIPAAEKSVGGVVTKAKNTD